MPGSVANAAPVDTLPVTLSVSFVETREYLTEENRYRNGESQRRSMVGTSRKRWQIGKRLTATQLEALRTFYVAHRIAPFYFYNPQETSPAWTLTPSGTQGRYTVRFEGEWSQSLGLGRSDCGISLVEIG